MREKTGHSHTAQLEVAPPECDFMSVWYGTIVSLRRSPEISLRLNNSRKNLAFDFFSQHEPTDES